MKNPLSPLVYHLRHKRSTLLLIAIVCLATVGIYVMVSVLDSIPMRSRSSYLTKISRVYPAAGDALEPGVVAQIETHPDVARAIPDNGLHINAPTLIGLDSARLAGVSQGDAQYLIAHIGLRLKEGRMFAPRTDEIVLSEVTARVLGLRLGDTIDRSVSEEYYGAIPAPLVLVGILESDPTVNKGSSIRVGFVSYEYLASHEQFAPRPVGLLVVAQAGRQAAVEEFLETTVASARTETETFREVSQLVTMARRGLYLIFGVVNCVVALIVALVVGVINRIALTQRTEELGLLHAVGYQPRQIVGRLTLETALVTFVGWIAGVGFALAALYGLNSTLYYARGMELDLGNLAPFWFALPAPLAVIAQTAWSAWRTFARFDPVAIIERGKLSMEAGERRRPVRRSSTRPLSSRTFYQRHPRRGTMLVASTALMIMGVAFPVFLTSASLDATKPAYEYLYYVSDVTPLVGRTLDPGATAHIRSHPAVARAIPAMQLGLQALVPPGAAASVNVCGVSESDLPVLMSQLGVALVEGRLPRPRSNEIVISRATALNRGWRVGDTPGGQSETDPLLIDDVPTEMVIAGLLSRSCPQPPSRGCPPLDDLWVGLASLEYLESHELTASRPVHLLVVPAAGRKAELDAWLEGSVASNQIGVDTYSAQERLFQQIALSMAVLFALVESLIAAVAAIALAALNYIFFSQRREEFGILHAAGRSRSWLVSRTAQEVGSMVGLAWLIGAAVCVVGLIIFQAVVYAPRGLHLDFGNLTPWLFTLPIPLAVVIAGTGTIAQMLRRLDPVAVIERR